MTEYMPVISLIVLVAVAAVGFIKKVAFEMKINPMVTVCKIRYSLFSCTAQCRTGTLS